MGITDRMKHLPRLLVVGMLSSTLVFAACGDDGEADGDAEITAPTVTATVTGTGKAATSDASDQSPEDVEDAVRDALAAQADGDLDAFLERWTDRGLQAEFRASRAEIQAGGADAIRQEGIEAEAFRNTRLSGATATTTVDINSGASIIARNLGLVFEDDMWRIDASEPALVQVPAGAAEVAVGMTEFAFNVPQGAFEPGRQTVVTARNVGQQPHELVLVRLDDNVNLEEALQSEGEPEGVEFIGFTLADPGDQSNFLTTEDLEEGRYAMVCFLPDTTDPAGTPHAFKGMVLEFRAE